MIMPEYWGIAGHPIKHSLTPKIFKIIGKHLGIINPKIVFIDVKNIEEFENKISRLEGDIWISITTPLKHAIGTMMDNSPDTKVNSINQIMRISDKLFGIDTDGDGFVNALRYLGISISGSKLKLKGGGSSARSIANSWSKEGGKLIIIKGRRELINGPWDKSIIKDTGADFFLDLDENPGSPINRDSIKNKLSITYNKFSTENDFAIIMLVAQQLKAWEIFYKNEKLILPSIKIVLNELFNS
jgi:shikimate 5-dehydrogenase